MVSDGFAVCGGLGAGGREMRCVYPEGPCGRVRAWWVDIDCRDNNRESIMVYRGCLDGSG